MANVAIAFPLLPNQADAARQFAQELMGARHAAFVAAEREHGFTRQYWFLQPTPAGTLLVAYIESDDPLRAFQSFAASQTPFDLWYKQQVKALSGLDLSQPPPALPEQILAFTGQ